MQFNLQRVLASHPLPEVSRPYALAISPDRRFLAVAHSFEDYQWHGRDISGGRVYPERVDVYALPSLDHLCTLGPQGRSFNDLAFHPTLPLLAVASGAYDGGWMYRGRLDLCDLERGDQRSLLKHSRAVLRCRFSDDGAALQLVIQPATDPAVEEVGTAFLRSELHCANWRRLAAESVDLGTLPTAPLYNVAEDDLPASATTSDVEAALRALLDTVRAGGFTARPPLFDIAWTPAGEILVTGPDVALERWQFDGVCTARLDGEGINAYLVPTLDGKHVYVSRLVHDAGGRYGWESHGEVERIDLASLARTPIAAIDRAALLSQDAAGRLLARDTGSTWHPEALDDRLQADLVLDESGAAQARLNLSYYVDYLRIEGAPGFYIAHRALQPGPSLLTLEPAWIGHLDGATTALALLFPVGTAEEEQHSQSLDGGLYIADGQRGSMMLATHEYAGSPRPTAFVVRRRLPDGLVLWKQPLPARVVGLARIPGRDLAAFSTDQAQVGLLDLASGAIIALHDVAVRGVPVVLCCLAAHGERMAAGALDGRILVFGLSEAEDLAASGSGVAS